MKQFHRKSLLIDTNLLLLLLIGSLSPSLIKKNKITANHGFDEVDFNQLRDFIDRFSKLVTTPHILAEVSNHTDKIKGADRANFLQQFISLIEGLDECLETSKQLTKTDAFARFGLTDSAICRLADDGILVLTIDFPLAGYLEKKGVSVINFNKVRQIPEINWASY